MDAIIAGIGSAIVSILVAYLTAYYKTRSELSKDRAKLHLDVVMKQKHDYFFPFKYCADEFRGRLIHIERTLRKKEFDDDKYEDMAKRFRQDFLSKDLEWFFNDTIGPEGGYFIASTIYLNCLVFYWMKRIQVEQPFISLKIKVKSEEMSKYFDEDQYLASIKEKCDIHDFIKNIKIAISRKNGIPYALHDSFGDFLFDCSRNRVINYEEFCEQLREDKKRVKFLPVLNFWTGLVDAQNKVNEERLKKISILIAILDLLRTAEIREEIK